jgi:hypothetical protein
MVGGRKGLLSRPLFPRPIINYAIDDLNIALVISNLGFEGVKFAGEAVIIFIAKLNGGEHVFYAFFEFVLELQLAFLAFCDLSLQLEESAIIVMLLPRPTAIE